MTTERNSLSHTDHEIPPIGSTEYAGNTATPTASRIRCADGYADGCARTSQNEPPDGSGESSAADASGACSSLSWRFCWALLGLAGWFGISALQAKQEADAALTAAHRNPEVYQHR